MQRKEPHKVQDGNNIGFRLLCSWLFKSLICISILLALTACDETSAISEPPYSGKTTLNLQRNKANFLVLTNTSSSTVSGVSVSLSSYRDDSKSALDLSVMASIITPNLLKSAGRKSPEVETDSVLHAHLPEIPPPSQLLSDSGNAPEGFSAKTLAAPLTPNFYTEGNTQDFNVSTNDISTFGNKTFTLYKKVRDSGYTVHYWVATADYAAANTSASDNIVGDDDLDNLADKFSDPDTSSDILSASIDIFGAPWGSYSSRYNSVLIPSSTTDFHILVHDIANDGYSSGGRIVGYFYNRDNRAKAVFSTSNEKLILNIDAPYLSRFPVKTYSAAIHEFQHVIQFYQKAVRRSGQSTEIWLSEMMAQIAVDLVSPKIGLGDESLYSAIGDYLAEPWESLTKWDSTVRDYNPISDFGAFLLRRYAVGGSSEALARQFIQNSYVDYRAITSATGGSWGGLLKEWGRTTLNGYPASNELKAIDPWTINGTGIGIPMFYLPSSISSKVLYFDKTGRWTNYYQNVPNSIEAPGPGSHVYVYLGKPITSAITAEITAPAGIAYEIVAK